MRLGIQEAEPEWEIPDEVCNGCYNELMKLVSHGAKLRAERQAREHNKVMLWKSRVELIKHARNCLTHKSLSEAAMAYEKYLKILELVFEIKGELTPEVFKDRGAQKELTIISSVYWDLACIYDSSPRYHSRQEKAVEQLIRFAPLTPIFPDILKKGQILSKTGKNKQLFKKFLKKAGIQSGRCFVATSAFEGRMTHEVQFLYRFRDTVLRGSRMGRRMIALYYRISPYFAQKLDAHSIFKPLVRALLKAVVVLLKASFRLP